MERIKVVIIDKNVLARRALSNVLKKDKIFSLLKTSGDVKETESIVKVQQPDVLLFNIEDLKSKEYSEFLNLRKTFPELSIIVLTTRTEEGAQTAIEVLKDGAVDIITKPRECTGLLFAYRHLTKRVIPIVKNVGTKKTTSISDILKSNPKYQPEFESIRPSFREEDIHKDTGILVIGGCTGGPIALFSIIPRLPEKFPFPVVVAQHFPKKYTRVLASELNKRSALTVEEGFDGAVLEPGRVWIAPGGLHTEIDRFSSLNPLLKTYKGVRELGNRPSINILFRSAANAYQSKSLGLILSGCGQDGVEGAAAIQNNGGQVLVQDPRTALAPELPVAMLHAGITDKYYTVDEMLHYLNAVNSFHQTQGKRRGNPFSRSQKSKGTDQAFMSSS